MFTLIFLISVSSNPIQQYGVDSGRDFQTENACLDYAESSFGQSEMIQAGAKSFDCIVKQPD